MSDLHLEFAPIEITNTDNADILVLSGDILVADRFTRSEASPYFLQAQGWVTWFEAVCAQYDRVFYVLGNHEHYFGRFDLTTSVLDNALGHIQNLYILDNECIEYKGLAIVGTTLWTDFDGSPVKAAAVQYALNDYKCIQRPGYQKLRPSDTVAYHMAAKQLIDAAAQGDKPVLVFSHHAPSYRSATPQYRGDQLNPGYMSHMDQFILDRPRIHLWTHGHVHSSHRYKIGNCLVAANPRGYAHKNREGQENEQFVASFCINI